MVTKETGMIHIAYVGTHTYVGTSDLCQRCSWLPHHPSALLLPFLSLSEISAKFTSENITYISDKLMAMIVDSAKSESRDIVADGLHTMVASITEEHGKVSSNYSTHATHCSHAFQYGSAAHCRAAVHVPAVVC